VSRLYAEPDELPAWAARLRCPRCGQERSVEDALEEWIDGYGRLVCLDCGDPAFGEGYGLLALRGRRLDVPFERVARALLRGEYGPASPADYRVLLALGGWADRDGWAWPSVPSLMRATGYSRATVHRALRRLERDHGLVAERRPGESTRYLVGPILHGETAPDLPGGVSPVRRGGLTGETGGVSPARPERDVGNETKEREPADAGSRAPDGAPRPESAEEWSW
jgi:DNA-binding transcriptional ArsR family regulator